MEIETGELEFRGNVERKNESKNAYGEIENSWKSVGTYWGKLKPLSQRSSELAKGFGANVNYEWLCFYRPEIDNDCRISVSGKQYYVSGVIHDIRKVWTQAFLTEQAN